MFNEDLDRLIDGETIKKVGGNYFSYNNFKLLRDFALRYNDHSIVFIYLWEKDGKYVIRIRDDYDGFDIYYLEWPSTIDHFTKILRRWHSGYDVCETIEELLKVIRDKYYFDNRYGLR
jgi:hypothetical protein